jgi:hypothetical protein
MKKIISEDEWYPVYAVDDDKCGWRGEGEFDIPDDKLSWIKTTTEEFNKVQKYLHDLITSRKEQQFARQVINNLTTEQFSNILKKSYEKVIKDMMYAGLTGLENKEEE